IAGISGGDIGQAIYSGMISSVVSSVTAGLNSTVNLSGTAGDISTMFFGTVSGGLSAELTGGNFWQGAATGLVVSGLNHVAHKTFTNDCPKCPKFKRWAEKRGGNTDLQKHVGDAIPLEEWIEIYKDKTYDEIVNENPKNMGMPGGPKKRYVIKIGRAHV